MRAEILTIGDEILIGQIVNTNSVWIAQQLNMIGVQVTHMASVSDEEKAIVKALDDASTRADLVFITGGLGPTKDDITKKTIAAYLDTPLEMDEEVLSDVDQFFTKRGRVLTDINRMQALVPKGCFVIRNKNGTAPGMWLKKGNTTLVSMPGVPHEMKAMMLDTVLPKIKAENVLPFIYHQTVLTQGIGESALAELIADWEDALAAKHIKLAYLPQAGQVRLRLSASGTDHAALRSLVDREVQQLAALAGQYIFGYEAYGEATPTLEKIVSDLLRERKQTLALAESCTGGYVASLITALPGASEIFKGAMVPYTNTAKHELLNVDNTVFDTVGAVSEACVIQLAENVRKKFDSSYAIAISGIAGPTGGTDEKPVGTVWIALASENTVIARKFQFGTNRHFNIVMTANAALNLLRKLLVGSADL